MQAETIGSLIRERRNSRGQTLRGLALSVGITPPFLSDIERGRRFPSDKTRAKLATALGLEKATLDRFDYRRDMRRMEELVRDNPELQTALRSALDRIAEGRMTPEKLTRAIIDTDTLQHDV